MVELFPDPRHSGFNCCNVKDNHHVDILGNSCDWESQNAIIDFAYSGVKHEDALKTLIRKFGQLETVAKAHLDKLNCFPSLETHNSDSIISFASTISNLVVVFKSTEEIMGSSHSKKKILPIIRAPFT